MPLPRWALLSKHEQPRRAVLGVSDIRKHNSTRQREYARIMPPTYKTTMSQIWLHILGWG